MTPPVELSPGQSRPYRQFSYVPTIDGFDVVCDLTGHTVVAGRPTAQSANGVAQSLNEAARHGVLDRALGCIEDRPFVGTLRTSSRPA